MVESRLRVIRPLFDTRARIDLAFGLLRPFNHGMASKALAKWWTKRRSQLDELELAHRSVGGTGPGRRFATQQINHAYAVLLSSQFQGFCRDLHIEARDTVIAAVPDATLRDGLRALMAERKIDRGNANRGNLGSDFNRFGFDFLKSVYADHRQNRARTDRLEELVNWRNSIAHQDFAGDPRLPLRTVRGWRRDCHALAEAFDRVVGRQVRAVVGRAPW